MNLPKLLDEELQESYWNGGGNDNNEIAMTHAGIAIRRWIKWKIEQLESGDDDPDEIEGGVRALSFLYDDIGEAIDAA